MTWHADYHRQLFNEDTRYKGSVTATVAERHAETSKRSRIASVLKLRKVSSCKSIIHHRAAHA